jgi:hypothetical protein
MGAGRVPVEAELEGVLQLIKVEKRRTALIRAIQKRAVGGRLRHFRSSTDVSAPPREIVEL